MAIMFENREFVQYIMFSMGKYVEIIFVEFNNLMKEYYVLTMNDGELYIPFEDFFNFIADDLIY